MVGAILGDVIGSVYEFWPYKSKDFELFKARGRHVCYCTDDSMMTLAVADAFLNCKEDFSDLPERTVESMQRIGKDHPDAGYGGNFNHWLYSKPVPYNSFGNGAAMRVSPCAYVAESLEQALFLSDCVTGVTHNHPEGIKAARAVTACIYMALHGESKENILKHVKENYYPLEKTLDEIRPDYSFDVTCMGSVPESIQCFAEAESCEDAIRNAVSLGGDADTMAAIAGSIAEAYFGIPENWEEKAMRYIVEADDWYGIRPYLIDIYLDFRHKYL